MPKLAIVGTIEVAPGHRDRLLPSLMEHRARCLGTNLEGCDSRS